MKHAFLPCLGLLVAVYAEVTLSLPILLLSIVFLSIFVQRGWIFFAALVAGILLDSLLFRPLGLTSAFYLGVMGIIFLYARKFEITNMLFITSMSLVSVFFYCLVFSIPHMVLVLVCSVVAVTVSFVFIDFLQKMGSKHAIL